MEAASSSNAVAGVSSVAPNAMPETCAQERRQAVLDRLAHVFRDAGTGPVTQRLFAVMYALRAGEAGEV